MKDTKVEIDEKMSLDEVMSLLDTTKNGLTDEEVQQRLAEYGPNALPEKKKNKILEFLSFLWNPLSWVMEIAAFIAIALANGGGQPPDYYDFIGIVVLLLLNAIIGFWENNQAENAVEALMAALALQARVKRNGNWVVIDAKELVPGDIISLKLGDVIPADAMLIGGGSSKVDQAALTGESLPVQKKEGDEVYSGATIKQGENEAVIIATGTRTFFGKAAKLVSDTESSGHFQQVMVKIGTFCLSVIAIFVFIEILVMYIEFKYEYRRGINNVLVLLIGGVPIAMPIVLSVTLAIGAHQLAQKKAIVTRMTAIEELAAMDVLCSDKTGTLTLNKLTIDDDSMVLLSKDVTIPEIKQKAAFASRTENQDAIDAAIVNTLPDPKHAREGIKELDFMPFDPVGKRTEITYEEIATGKRMRVSKGAPQIILGLCGNDPKLKQTVSDSIDLLAGRGLRALGVAECELTPDMKLTDQVPTWTYLGLLPIFDPPRHDTAETIQKAHARGISVKMITGDQLAIGKETARRLGLGTNMYETEFLMRERASIEAQTGKSIGRIIEESDGFAGVFPEHKYEIVNTLKSLKHTVGMTGDGVNDAPALKVADIGIAVDGATDAARSAADIVLTEPGLSVIIDAIDGSRKIFKRMKTYATYACTVTVRIVINFAVLCFAWRFDFPPFMVLIIAFLNDGAIMTISKDRVKPSMSPDSWKLWEIFIVGTVLGLYLTISTIVFFYTLNDTDWWSESFGLQTPWRQSGNTNDPILHSIIYLNVSITGQAVIFIVRSQTAWFLERPGVLLMCAFAGAQAVATIITVYADWGFTEIAGAGWGWILAIWVWSLVTVIPMDILKHAVLLITRGDLWRNITRMAVMSYDTQNPPQRDRIDPGSIRASLTRASIDTQAHEYRVSLRDSMSKKIK